MGKKLNGSERPGFLVYFEFADALKEYSFDEVGKFFFAMCDYAREGLTPNFEDRGLRGLWKLTKLSLDKDNGAYIERCRKNRYSAYVGVQRRLFSRNPANFNKEPVEGIDFLCFDDWFSQIDSQQSSANGCECQQSSANGSQLNKNYNNNSTELEKELQHNNNQNGNYNKNERGVQGGDPTPEEVAALLDSLKKAKRAGDVHKEAQIRASLRERGYDTSGKRLM